MASQPAYLELSQGVDFPVCGQREGVIDMLRVEHEVVSYPDILLAGLVYVLERLFGVRISDYARRHLRRELSRLDCGPVRLAAKERCKPVSPAPSNPQLEARQVNKGGNQIETEESGLG